MGKVYDSGDIALDDGGSDIIQNNWSDLEELTIEDFGAKIRKIVFECATAGSITGTLAIFSETNGSWANNGVATQAPMNTTGHVVSVAVDEAGEINDDIIYAVNNDATIVKKLYIAFYNTDATAGQFIVRVLYESLSVG